MPKKEEQSDMAWFGKKEKKQEEHKMTTLEQVRKAYEDLSDEDKKSFHQSIADRVHESVATQERADGNEDSQSAEAREHEALGAEHAEGKGDVAELHEKDNTAQERHEDAQDKRDDGQDAAREEADDWRKSVDERFAKIEASLEKLAGSDRLQNAREKYGLSPSASAGEGKREFTEEDVKKFLA